MKSEQHDVVYPAEFPSLGGGGGGGGGGSDFDEDLREIDDVLAANDGDEDDAELEDLNSPSPSSLALTATPTTETPKSEEMKTHVTVAVPSASAVTVAAIAADSDSRWHRMAEIVLQRPQIDDSRRLFQRLWTDEDEIELLRGFLEYTAAHRGTSSHPPDTAPFYEQIKSKLQLEFNKNQLVEKLRRLKKKYRNVMSKFNSGKEFIFKSPHDQATFEISRKIWNHSGKIIGFEDIEETSNIDVNNTNNNLNLNTISDHIFEMEAENGIEKKVNNNNSGSRKRPRSKLERIEEEKGIEDDVFVVKTNNNDTKYDDKNVGGGGDVAGLIKETVRSCLSPAVKEMLNGTTAMMKNMMGGVMPYAGAPLSPMVMPPHLDLGAPVGCGVGFWGGGKVVDERWRQQHIMELELYLRRLELVKDRIKATLQELRSLPGGGGG